MGGQVRAVPRHPTPQEDVPGPCSRARPPPPAWPCHLVAMVRTAGWHPGGGPELHGGVRPSGLSPALRQSSSSASGPCPTKEAVTGLSGFEPTPSLFLTTRSTADLLLWRVMIAPTPPPMGLPPQGLTMWICVGHLEQCLMRMGVRAPPPSARLAQAHSGCPIAVTTCALLCHPDRGSLSL